MFHQNTRDTDTMIDFNSCIQQCTYKHKHTRSRTHPTKQNVHFNLLEIVSIVLVRLKIEKKVNETKCGSMSNFPFSFSVGKVMFCF